MAIKELVLPEFEHEMATTRLLLERAPARHASRKPHPKSMSLGELASRLADIPFRVQSTIQAESSGTAPSGGRALPDAALTLREAAVERFDRNLALAQDAISGTDDANLMSPWSLLPCIYGPTAHER